jgi:hypothetical protein
MEKQYAWRDTLPNIISSSNITISSNTPHFKRFAPENAIDYCAAPMIKEKPYNSYDEESCPYHWKILDNKIKIVADVEYFEVQCSDVTGRVLNSKKCQSKCEVDLNESSNSLTILRFISEQNTALFKISRP